ncbi:MAG: TatD family hydrolase [Bacteroides sp.]|nr:TatD family hydrolase [Bacteroides sp.]MCM1413826.1 TatD family hydrolase [Bacteroides sp.]MCM1471230.1 TatD family hydrolase [Bacteroides sp.]
MTRIIDIHTHHLSHNAIVNIDVCQALTDGYLYSVGHHPWEDPSIFSEERLLQSASDPRVVAIGEAGLDALKGGSLEEQTRIFMSQIRISEALGKPLIIHCVRTHDRLLSIHREVKPRQPWIFHGFRLKPTIADALLREGLYLSLGPMFNADSAAMIPDDRLFIETDDDPEADIGRVAQRVASARSVGETTILDIVARNAEFCFKLPSQ